MIREYVVDVSTTGDEGTPLDENEEDGGVSELQRLTNPPEPSSDCDTLEEDDEDRRNLIINYLPQNIQDAQLSSIFEAFGDIESVKVVRDKMTKKCLGYGFIK